MNINSPYNQELLNASWLINQHCMATDCSQYECMFVKATKKGQRCFFEPQPRHWPVTKKVTVTESLEIGEL